jgi:dipeptide/tripeptide permease
MTEKATTWGHPKGLFYLFFAELWERFSFYGMRALLTLYMVEVVFEALSNKDFVTAAIYSSYGSLVYAGTVIGGRISDKLLGMRKSIFLGGIFMAIGHFVLAIEHNIAFFLALSFIIVGNAFLNQTFLLSWARSMQTMIRVRIRDSPSSIWESTWVHGFLRFYADGLRPHMGGTTDSALRVLAWS